MVSLYNKIDTLCKANKMSVSAMCRQLNISRSSLSELNAGRTKTLSATVLGKIAALFSTTVESLISESDALPNTINDKKNKPTAENGNGLAPQAQEFVDKVFSQMSVENRKKLLELADLYLAAEQQNKDKK